MELAQTPQVKCLVPNKSALTVDASCELGGPQLTCTSDPTGYKFRSSHEHPHYTALTLNASCKFRGPQASCTSDQLATNLGVSRGPLQVILLEQLIVFSRVLYLLLYFIVKDTNQDHLRDGKVWENPNCKAFMSSGCITLPAHQCVSPTRKAHPSFGCPQFLLVFNYIGMID